MYNITAYKMNFFEADITIVARKLHFCFFINKLLSFVPIILHIMIYGTQYF